MANSSRSTGPGCHSLRSTRRPWREGKRPARPATRSHQPRHWPFRWRSVGLRLRRFESTTCHTPPATAAQRWYLAALALEIARANRWRPGARHNSACWERLLARLRDAEPAVPAILDEVVTAPGLRPKSLSRRNAENKTRWYLSPTWRPPSGRTCGWERYAR